MSDRLDLQVREPFRAEIEATLAAIQARAIDLSAEAIAAELQAALDNAATSGFIAGLGAAYGPDIAAVAFADLTSRLAESDADIARRLGTTPQSVSKILARIRRNLGMPLRVPNNANGPLSRAAVTKGPSAN